MAFFFSEFTAGQPTNPTAVGGAGGQRRNTAQVAPAPGARRSLIRADLPGCLIVWTSLRRKRRSCTSPKFLRWPTTCLRSTCLWFGKRCAINLQAERFVFEHTVQQLLPTGCFLCATCPRPRCRGCRVPTSGPSAPRGRAIIVGVLRDCSRTGATAFRTGHLKVALEANFATLALS
jgi:hypothetical protein